MLSVVDWFEYSDFFLFNSSPVTELQETSGNVKMPAGLVYYTFLDLFRASCWRTVQFAVLHSSVHQSSVVYYFQRR